MRQDVESEKAELNPKHAETQANTVLFACYLRGRHDRQEGKPIPQLIPSWTPVECEAAYRGFEEAVWSGETR